VPRWAGKPAAIVEGYPAPVVPLVEFAVRKQGVDVTTFDKRWLDTREYEKFSAVFLVGSLTRAKATPDRFSADDLKRVDAYLKNGGTLVVVQAGKLAFQSPEGQAYLRGLTGAAEPKKGAAPKVELLKPEHPWVRHLDAAAPQPWQKDARTKDAVLWTGPAGERVVGSADGAALLYRVRVGKGQLVYIGWDVHAALPHTRDERPTPAAERAFEQQMGVLFAVAADLFPAGK
jgi:hypothetical protein